MLHAKSLRVIGQSLEAAGIAAFELEKNDQSYVVESAYVTREGESILRNALGGNDLSSQGAQQSRANRLFCFRAADISRLDAQARKKRKSQFGTVTRTPTTLSYRLRALGDHLDRIQVSVFRIVWTLHSVIIVYQKVDGQYHCKIFMAEEMQQLALHSRFQRSNANLLPQLNI
jgi:mRNA-degrading endonuclease RelE of RelBE toxin-antitoxin system